MVFVWYNTKFEFWWNDSVFKMQTHVRSCRTGDWDRPRRKLWRQLSMTRQNLSWNWISILSAKIKLENTNYMIDIYMRFLFLKMSIPATFRFFYKQTIQFLQQINVKKCPSRIQHWDLNPRPLEHESSPITTRSKLPPALRFLMNLINALVVTNLEFSHQLTYLQG